MDSYRDNGLYVGSVVITQYSGQESASLFRHRLEIWESVYTSTTVSTATLPISR